jgi:ribose/xylose/arabinose/galactoside ABC-type transport system permease subunit
MKVKLPKEIWLLIILIIVSVLIGIRNSVFFSAENLLDLLKGSSVIGICALGMTFIAMTGGIDVSVSAVIACVASIIGNFMFRSGNSFFNNVIVVFIISIACGAILGAINGFLIGKLKIPSIVATLGTLAIFRGVLFLITKGYWVNRFNLPEWLKSLSLLTVARIPIQVIIFIVLVIICWLIMKFTTFGRSVYAIGGSSISAMRIGINVDRIILYVYILMGMLTGIAAFVHTTIMVGVDPNSFVGFEFKVIGAVFIGGVAITGGRGSIFGAVVGVLLLAVISNGMIIARIPIFWHQVITGAVILAAISFDVIQRKRFESRLLKIDVAE